MRAADLLSAFVDAHDHGVATSQLAADPGQTACESLSDRPPGRLPRSNAEAVATGIQLYPILAGFALRARGAWSASGKRVPRRSCS